MLPSFLLLLTWQFSALERGLPNIYHNQDKESTEVSIMKEHIKKMWSISTMEYYSAIKRDETLGGLEDIISSKISQAQQDKYCMSDLVWKLENLFSRSKE